MVGMARLNDVDAIHRIENPFTAENNLIFGTNGRDQFTNGMLRHLMAKSSTSQEMSIFSPSFVPLYTLR